MKLNDIIIKPNDVTWYATKRFTIAFAVLFYFCLDAAGRQNIVSVRIICDSRKVIYYVNQLQGLMEVSAIITGVANEKKREGE